MDTSAYLSRILTARVYDVAMETPLEPAPRLSVRMENQLLLKREDLQPTFSFKVRGSFNKMVGLSDEQRRRGVIASSAGNHAQGVALAARKLGGPATLVMPVTTPELKVEAVRALGGTVILHGDSYDDAQAFAHQLAEEKGLSFIHPYDDPAIIAGQGTIGVEILRQCKEPIEALFIPVGGGGLAAGVGAYIKALKPETKVIGVEPDDAASMHNSLAAGRRVVLERVGLFADGVAVRQVGEETFRLCRHVLDEIILVDTDATCAALKDAYEDTRTVLEPAGALSVAGAKAYAAREKLRGKTLVAITSGANMNFDRLRHVSERAELGEGREAILAVTIPETPGSFKAFCAELGTASVTEFNYRYADPDEANIFVGVEVKKRAETEALAARLTARGLAVLDLSGNEMAKLHLRHLVGGRAPGLKNELLYRFAFPERPGALLDFLQAMPHTWNISLFHYRNHGTDYGRVLVGVQVPGGQRPAFQEFLDQLGYTYWDESDNEAYHRFLG